MAKIRSSIKKATKSTRGQASSSTTARLLPWDAANFNELYNTKVDVDEHFEFMDGITYEKRDLLVRDLCVEGAIWIGSHQKNYMMHHPFLTLEGKIWFHFVNCRLKPSTHSTTVTLDKMCLIHSIVKGQKIDVGAILHQEIADCAISQTRILVFPSLVMLLCQQRGIMPHAGEEILENNGPINKASVERMTRGKDTPILKGVETSKTRKGKAKVNSKRINLNTETSLWHKLKNAEKMVFDNEKKEESRDIEECLRKIDSLFEDGIFADKEDTVVEKEVDAAEAEVVAKEEVLAEEEKVAKNEKEKEEQDFVKKVVTALESIGPLQVASPTKIVADDVGAEPGTEEQSEDGAMPKEKEMKHSKDKKMKE
ncbi:hypothetical protein PVK06_024382 [Gossypium arboreum]|uniref:Putative plant transposon protein domain-containing protein n=1 Tax=Gossypium arboreum TaxID=29729 RepID=A0ABR0PE09_GOSAR|nr:hypothetical protein PVK06_024382 [Gossypium arboreum]